MYVTGLSAHTTHTVWSVLLFLGVNLPDHDALFAALSSQLRDKVTPYIATLQARHCTTIRSTIEHMVLQLMNYNKLHNVSLCTAFEQNLIMNWDNMRFWGFQGSEDISCGLLDCNTVLSTFWEHITSIFWAEAVTGYKITLHHYPEAHSHLHYRENPKSHMFIGCLTCWPFLKMCPSIIWTFRWNPSVSLLIGWWLGGDSEGQCKEESV